MKWKIQIIFGMDDKLVETGYFLGKTIVASRNFTLKNKLVKNRVGSTRQNGGTSNRKFKDDKSKNVS